MIRQLFKILSSVVLRSKKVQDIVAKVWPGVTSLVTTPAARAEAPVAPPPPVAKPVAFSAPVAAAPVVAEVVAAPVVKVAEVAAKAVEVAAKAVEVAAPTITLRALGAKETMDGSVWVPRILWALEYARRNQLGPQSASDISRVLGQGGVNVPSTNVARAFRDRKQDAAYWTEHDGQRYEISDSGSAAISAQLERTPN